MGEQLGLGFGGFGEAFLQHLCDAGVEVLTARLEERAVGSVLDQRVLEAVGDIGRGAPAVDQLSRDQLVERRLQLRLGSVGDRGEQAMRKLAP